jgi:hypothetical protein
VRRASYLVNRIVACRQGERTGCAWVCEYPKSGGTWFGKMLADVLGLPYPAPPLFPVTFPAVMHNHWTYDPRLRRCCYLVRDGRDVMVSFFFHRMRRIKRAGIDSNRAHAPTYRRLFGRGYDPDDAIGLLPRFIEREFARPRDCRVNWARHVDGWAAPDGHPHVTYLSYEELLEDCAGTLTRTVRSLTGQEPDPWRIGIAVEKFSMARMTGRTQGQEDRSSFVRKGIAGDWRNHFTRETAELFDRLAGDTLVRLGYEPDRSWIEACPDEAELRARVAAEGEGRDARAGAGATDGPGAVTTPAARRR